jgi:hypothetical protein
MALEQSYSLLGVLAYDVGWDWLVSLQCLQFCCWVENGCSVLELKRSTCLHPAILLSSFIPATKVASRIFTVRE